MGRSMTSDQRTDTQVANKPATKPPMDRMQKVWMGVGVGGIVAAIAFFAMGSSQRSHNRKIQTDGLAQTSTAGSAARVRTLSGRLRETEEAKRADTGMKPGAAPIAPAPAAPAPPAPAPPPPADVSPPPPATTDSTRSQGEAPEPKGASTRSGIAKPVLAKGNGSQERKKSKPMSRGMDLDDGASEALLPAPRVGSMGNAAGVSPAAEQPGRVAKSVRRKAGKAPHEKEKQALPRKDKAAQTVAEEGGESQSAEDELKGWFGMDVPQRMLLGETVRVRVTASEKSVKAKAEAKLDALPAGEEPKQRVSAEIPLTKRVRVELRVFPSAFEVLPLKPAEQTLHDKRVTTWEWNLVSRQAGLHDVSVVVSNLSDVGHELEDVTLETARIEVDVSKMQRVKEVGSLLSSALGGVLGLLGAYKGILRPLMGGRRREDEDDDRGKRGKKEGGGFMPPPDHKHDDEAIAQQPHAPAPAEHVEDHGHDPHGHGSEKHGPAGRV